MGEEADTSDYGRLAAVEDDGRVLEWEIGLPSAEDLTPLSQTLIPLDLASAFSIAPEPSRSMLEVHRASRDTVSSLRRQAPSHLSPSSSTALKAFPSYAPPDDPMVIEADEATAKDEATESSRKVRRSDAVAMEESDSTFRAEDSNDDHSARTLKRPRLVWTPQLHKRFVDVVAHLGIKNAVPKTIMQLMNVEGLTRENVASHLQKYRLYLRRIQGLSNEEPSTSDQLFASTPVPDEPSVLMPMQNAALPALIRMPVLGMAHHPVAMVPVNGQPGGGVFPYGAFGEQRRDWPHGNKFGSVVSFPGVMPNDK